MLLALGGGAVRLQVVHDRSGEDGVWWRRGDIRRAHPGLHYCLVVGWVRSEQQVCFELTIAVRIFD